MGGRKIGPTLLGFKLTLDIRSLGSKWAMDADPPFEEMHNGGEVAPPTTHPVTAATQGHGPVLATP